MIYRKPSPKEKKKRKKSPKQIQRDNERAAKFQEKKRQEEAAAKAASGVPPPATSSPAASTVREASVNFSFASPVAEDRTDNAMEGISDPQPSRPEDLRQHLEDPPSLTLPHEEESVRDNPAEPNSENITISEEVLQENQDAASEETESPGLATTVHDVGSVRERFKKSNSQDEWIIQSAWFQANWEKMTHNDFLKPGGCRSVEIFREYQQAAAKYKFRKYLLQCKKPKLFSGSSNEEPCNSPDLLGCRGGCNPVRKWGW